MSRIHRIEVPIPFPLKTMNCYYIEDSTPTLIDTGINTPEAFEALRKGVEDCGGALSDIRKIILTHAHSDHAGMAGRLAEMSGASVFLHTWDRGRFFAATEEGHGEYSALFMSFFEEAGVPEELAEETTEWILRRFRNYISRLSDMDLLTGGEVFSFDTLRLEVIHAPGHSAGSICLFSREDGLLFSGDSILQRVAPNAMAEIRRPDNQYVSIRSYQRSLEQLYSLPVDSIRPGHGAPFSGHRERIDQLRKIRSHRLKTVLRFLRREQKKIPGSRGMTLYEASDSLFPGAAKVQLFMILSEVLGLVDMMEDAGLASVTISDGRKLYNFH